MYICEEHDGFVVITDAYQCKVCAVYGTYSEVASLRKQLDEAEAEAAYHEDQARQYENECDALLKNIDELTKHIAELERSS